MPTLPPARVPVHYTAGSGSSPPSVPSGAARSVVVGNAAGLPAAGFRFDGDSTEPWLDESVVARIEPDHASLTSDLTTLYRSVRLQGGAATLLPDGARITGLALLSGGPGPGDTFGWPFMSTDRDLFTDCLCVIAVDAEAGGAGLYYWVGPGELYRFPQTVQASHLCLTQATGTLYIGTPHGVYSRTSDPTDTSTAWERVGAFARRVVRLEPRAIDADHVALWALVQDKDQGGTVYHGIYRHPAYDAASSSADIEGDWQPIVRAGELVDMVPSGPDDVWFIAKADPENVHHLTLDEGGPSVTDTVMALPSGAQGTHLSFVLGPPSHAVSAVYCSVAGTDHPLYGSRLGGGGTWSAFDNADGAPAGSLRDPSGAVVGVNAVVPSGLTFLGWTGGHLEGEAGAYVAAWACTTSGLFWTPSIGAGGAAAWQPVSGSSGLDDVSVGNVAAGQWQSLIGQPANRVFVTNAERLYVSSTSTNLWEEAAPHAPVTLAVALNALVYQTTGRLMDNMVQTVGGMASTPLVRTPPLGANTHVQVPHILPDGWWYQRTLDQYWSWEWTLTNGAVTSTSRLFAQEVSDLAAESSSRVAQLTASGRLMETSIIYLGEHSTARADLTVQTTFVTQEGAARRLRATMAVPVRYHGAMLARSGAGDALSTIVVALDDALLFVKSVTLEAASDLGPGAGVATVELSTTLSDERDASAIAAALLETARNIHKKQRQ